MKVGIVKDEIFLKHEPPYSHPENPQRLKEIYKMLPDQEDESMLFVTPREAKDEIIALNHDPSYIEFLRETEKNPYTYLDPDTYACPYSFKAAKMAVGGLLDLVDLSMEGKIKGGFALIRPPGHHAERSKAMGFCLFNNVACGAWYLLKRYNLKRVLIVDFDLHHGNGTQRSFYESKEVLYFSIHQYPYYPGTGDLKEIGKGDGEGYTVNVPLPPGMEDGDYIFVFKEILLPLSEEFRPEFILVSAGFDAHRDDPLGGMRLTEKGYGKISRILLEIAEKCCPSKILFSLEGGYNIKALSESVRVVLSEMKKESVAEDFPLEPKREVQERVKSLKRLLSPFFKFL